MRHARRQPVSGHGVFDVQFGVKWAAPQRMYELVQAGSILPTGILRLRVFVEGYESVSGCSKVNTRSRSGRNTTRHRHDRVPERGSVRGETRGSFIFEFPRVKQWVKNAFIFFRLFLRASYLKTRRWSIPWIAFLGFLPDRQQPYILNDYLDRDKDRLHPRKSQRSRLRAWNVPGGTVKAIIVFLVMAGPFCRGWQVNAAVFAAALFAIALHLGYNFLPRVVVPHRCHVHCARIPGPGLGRSANIEVVPSVWLQMCVFILALFLRFTKRRHEIKTLGDTANHHRGSPFPLHGVFAGPDHNYLFNAGHRFYWIIYNVRRDDRTAWSQHDLYGHFRHLRDIPVSLPEPCASGDDPGEVPGRRCLKLLINVLFMIRPFVTCFIIHPADAKISSLLAWALWPLALCGGFVLLWGFILIRKCLFRL